MGPVTNDIQAQIEAYTERQQMIYHTPVDLGINRLKRELKETFPNWTKAAYNRFVKAYKKRSWMEYSGTVRHRGTFPSHPNYGKSVKVTTKGLDVEETINVTRNKK